MFTSIDTQAQGQEGFIGEVKLFAGNFAPRTWALCEGQLLAISSKTALFSIVGTMYGGDGRTTFGLPDLRGRTAIGVGHGPGLSDIRIGQRGGLETKTLTTLQLPNHTHNAGTLQGTIMCNEEDGTSDEPEGKNFGIGAAVVYNSEGNDKVMSANTVSVSGATSATGGQQAFDIRNPYLGLNYIICLQGVYPSRN
ncbi:MAG: phage tail protein [Lutibacter sp.]|nr:MAG: phage tail protein [Lutibacter sp.]